MDIPAGEIIEAGTSNQINCNGQRWQMVFTWENPDWGAAPEDRKKWGICSGHAAFYNTSKDPNTKMLKKNLANKIISFFARCEENFVYRPYKFENLIQYLMKMQTPTTPNF